MDSLKKLTPFLSVAPQITTGDVGSLSALGFRAIINNRPDGEGPGQPPSAEIAEAAKRLGLDYRHIPVVSGQVTDEAVAAFTAALEEVKGPVLAFCRTGTRSTTLWALSEAHHLSTDAIVEAAAGAGYDLANLRTRLDATASAGQPGGGEVLPFTRSTSFDVLIIGGGAAGCATAASIRRRRPSLSIAIVEPSDKHYYQPAWTLVGGGAFDRAKTERSMERAIPNGVRWIRAAAAGFEPDRNLVVLEDGTRLAYRTLVVAPGLQLRWDLIEGLSETLGKNGVTSNYLFDLAPYTWELVQGLKKGKAIFTQPPMPIKCAGAPQKAMYLSCDHWLKSGALKDIDVELDNAGAVLFGVGTFVPPLMKYVEKYGAHLAFNSNLKAIDGAAKTAFFDVKAADGTVARVEKKFDMIHVVPPQTAPEFIRNSPFADAAGWVDVDQETLRHKRYGNVFSLGDASSAPNAKTAAAVRKQAPVVAENVLAVLEGKSPHAVYDGYGSCPLTVEKGKVVLAEFGYGGKLLPTFPMDPAVPRRTAWFLKARMLPTLYWDVMLKGHEWLAKPTILPHEPQEREENPSLDDCAKSKRVGGGAS
ncbi:bifunctional protein tyrosine phosphatase family protein/NAD(P)/FAD-dependent oxidoreductase [Zavarzinia compransoris]|uniref:bifunctional protein tyrosine phosphatase family protein/NAD(P)/FAD-dependent oxidoreductase n=1 Tax=Zavarzinia marina TaxID=2911065 RepID=UPI001F1A0E01|nr:bifunctional protein tyrosine phosphatase family protein/NAD(P)/FAD-dependent oxidoreductase [Zavarzinia marina]MCF4165885.1 bifunctional protein tyrosine phosphatase family protein/NAD(P)/FAD-dependent oxidoreductase [Zavarzinia marina]